MSEGKNHGRLTRSNRALQTRDGGTTRPPLSDSRCVSQSSGPQTFWRRGGAHRTAQETPVLDNAFALIVGHCNNLKIVSQVQ